MFHNKKRKYLDGAAPLPKEEDEGLAGSGSSTSSYISNTQNPSAPFSQEIVAADPQLLSTSPTDSLQQNNTLEEDDTSASGSGSSSYAPTMQNLPVSFSQEGFPENLQSIPTVGLVANTQPTNLTQPNSLPLAHEQQGFLSTSPLTTLLAQNQDEDETGEGDSTSSLGNQPPFSIMAAIQSTPQTGPGQPAAQYQSPFNILTTISQPPPPPYTQSTSPSTSGNTFTQSFNGQIPVDQEEDDDGNGGTAGGQPPPYDEPSAAWMLEQLYKIYLDLDLNTAVQNIDRKKAWEVFDDIHGLFQALRTLMRFCTLGHSNTYSELHGHPVADFFERVFEDLERGWDDTGSASGLAFTVLSLVYLAFLFIVGGKILKNIIKGEKDANGQLDIFADLPKGIIHSIAEAAIWGPINLVMAIIAFLPNLDSSVVGLSTYLLFSVAVALDVINAVIAHTKGIKEIEKRLGENNLADGEKEELERNLQILQWKRITYICLGISVVSGGLCLMSSEILTFMAGGADNVTASVAHLAFAGGWLLAGAAILFAVVRGYCEWDAYQTHYNELQAKIDNPGYPGSIDKTKLINLQKEVLYNQRKSTAFYMGLTVVLIVSLFAGPVAGLIAFSVFLAANILYKYALEPKVKPHIKKIAPTPSPITAAFKKCFPNRPAGQLTPAIPRN